MAMKYIKLFERWELTEAGAFDVNDPSALPVKDITIGDLRKAIKSGKGDDVLLSITRRSAQTEKVWNPDAGKDIVEYAGYSVAPAKRGIKEFTRVKRAMEKLEKPLDYQDGGKYEKLWKDLSTHIQKQNIFKKNEKYSAKKYADVLKKFSDYVTKVEKMTPEERIKFTGVDSTHTKPILKQIVKDMEELLVALQGKPAKPSITVEGKDLSFNMEMDLTSINDTSLNPDDAPVTDLICTGLKTLQVGDEAQDISVEENQLTLGMVMTWINNYAKTKSSKDALLSSTGFKTYKKDIASVLSGEGAKASA